MPSSTFLNLPAEKQEKLLEAATREFSHRPFNEASINQIIKEAGIPRGSFYMYFTDKEELFGHLMDSYGALLERRMGELLEQRDKMTFVYGTGFSGTVATYLTQKLVNMGILCFSATGGDSVGIFENTLDRMGLFFCISKSGETSMVRDKIKTAQENGVCTVAITGEQENSVGRYADLWFRVENQWKLDDQNTMPNTFFPQVMMLIELITYEYRRLCMENGIK